jgi:hypothetical protein
LEAHRRHAGDELLHCDWMLGVVIEIDAFDFA